MSSPHRQGANFQQEPTQLKLQREQAGIAITAANFAEFIAKDEYGKCFIYFQGGPKNPNSVLWRLYLNVRMNLAAISGVMGYLGEMANNSAISGLVDFKITGYTSFGSRCDKIVAYFNSQGQAATAARDLAVRENQARPNEKWFQSPVPMFTHPIGAGIALGVEPGYLLTGFKLYEPKRPEQGQSEAAADAARRRQELEESQHSFGSIRASLLATAGYYFVLNKKRYGSNPGAFLRWVAVVCKIHLAELHPERYNG